MTEPQERPPEKKTLWGRLGRGVAQGWEMAKETTHRIGDAASQKLELSKARDHLLDRYRLLGRMAAERFITRGETAMERDEETVRAVVEEIRTAQGRIAELEHAEAQRPSAESNPAPPANPER